MLPASDLLFAQRYPFSQKAQNVRKQSDIALDELPEEVVERAKAIVLALASKGTYAPSATIEHHGILTNEVMAFPLVKLLLSAVANEELYSRFARAVSEFSLQSMQQEHDEVLGQLAKDLGIEFEQALFEPRVQMGPFELCSKRADSRDFFAKVPLNGFLKCAFRQEFLRLVHMPLSKGFVYLERHDFMRLVAEAGFSAVRSSLPIPKQKIPRNIQDMARELGARIVTGRKQMLAMPAGNVKPENFPPCMAELYSALASGQKLGHTARFALATFLLAVGMPKHAVVELFKNAPNFNRRITEYQLERISHGISGNRYSPFSCAKMRSNQLCNAECNVKHPLQHYRNNAFSGSKGEAKDAVKA